MTIRGSEAPLVALARRHGETAIAAVITLALGRWAALAALDGAWLGALLWGTGAGAAALWARAAFTGRRLASRLARGPEPGPGIVRVEEGRITYFGPEQGGAAAIDLLVTVSLSPEAERAVWLFESADGRSLAIPSDAIGAERLPDALAVLPGFDPETAARAAEARAGAAAVPVWRRPPATRIARS